MSANLSFYCGYRAVALAELSALPAPLSPWAPCTGLLLHHELVIKDLSAIGKNSSRGKLLVDFLEGKR